MNILIFCLIIIGIGSIVNKLTKQDVVSKRKIRYANGKDDAQIEVGYPALNSRALHINNTKEQPLPDHTFTVEEVDRYQGEDDDSNYKSIYTVNMFVESHYELNISLFEKELTTEIINTAYSKSLNEHVKCIQKGEASPFNIVKKQKSRDYLIKSLEKTVKP
jgi:hypothetical protein